MIFHMEMSPDASRCLLSRLGLHWKRLYEDIQSKLDEGSLRIGERTLLREWLLALLAYEEWFCKARFSYFFTAVDLLDPPAFVFRPERKDNSKNMVLCFVLFSKAVGSALSFTLPESVLRREIDVVQSRLL